MRKLNYNIFGSFLFVGLFFLNPSLSTANSDLSEKNCRNINLPKIVETVEAWEEYAPLVSCKHKSFNLDDFFDIALAVRRFIESYEEGDLDHFLPICNKNGNLVSVAIYLIPENSSELKLGTLLADPFTKGAGKAAIQGLFELGRKLKKTTIHLVTHGTSDGFYRKMGFIEDPSKRSRFSTQMNLPLTYQSWLEKHR